MKKVRHTMKSTTVIFTNSKRRRFKIKKSRRLVMKKAGRKYRASPKGAYAMQKCNARRRGISWLFTFDTWWRLWQESGQWERRGRSHGFYCMARRGDTGPYSPENCLIVLWEINSQGSIVTAGLAPASSVPDAVGLYDDCPF